MKNIAQMIKIQIITTLNKDNVVHHIKILFNKKIKYVNKIQNIQIDFKIILIIIFNLMKI